MKTLQQTKISNKEIISRITKLSNRKIDELFFRCGWQDMEKGDNKALPEWRIEEIKSNKADSLIETFIEETSKEDIISNLIKLEKESN